MTRRLLPVVVLALAPAALAAPGPSRYCAQTNVEAVDGAIRLAQCWAPVLQERFDQGLGAWKVENFENKLIVEVVDASPDAGKCLRVSNKASDGDTAFEVASAPIPVLAERLCRFQFGCRSTAAFETLEGHKGHYLTELDWLDASGKLLSQTPFGFGKSSKDWRATCLEARAPANTASAVIRFGFDLPNIEKGRMLEIRDVRLYVHTEPSRFETSGTVLSRPLLAPSGTPRRLAWQADMPPGTALRFQVASAPDRDGGPGEWSAPAGPDGTTTSYFEAPGELPTAHDGRPWLRYMATFATTDPAKTSVLRGVTLGLASDGPWAGPDTEPPAVTERSPTRTPDAAAPIWFRLADATGVDPGTLRVVLDETDITAQVRLQDGKHVFTPPAPLKPRPVGAGFSGWKVENYQNALTITQTARRTADAPAGYHITREAVETDTGVGLQSPLIPVVPGETYRFSYWSRHSLDLSHSAGKGALQGGVAWLGEKNVPVGDLVPIPFGPANPDWHQDTLELTAPAGALCAQIAFAFDTPNLFGGAFVDIAEVRFDGKVPTDRDDARPNLHSVTVKATDFAGNTLARTWYILYRAPRTTGLVTLRDDGMTLIDGKPFFPIGPYAVWKKPFNDNSFDKAFGDLKAAGFNFAHTYNSTRGPDFTEFLAAAARHDIRLFIASGAGANCVDAETVVADVVREEAEPAILSWYLADDTASHVGCDELRALTEALHDVDPSRITCQADGVGSRPVSRYTNFVNSTDVFLPELYPIRDDSDKGVPQIIADMKTIAADLDQAGTHRKGNWAIIQYFQGWGWPRYPTRDELWAMTYLSIIHGANGMTWYTYGGWGKNFGVTDTPEAWKNICALAGELAKLQDVFVERTGPQPAAPTVTSGPDKDALGFPSIGVLLKEHAGKKYLLAANSARAAVTATFSLPGAKRLDLPFENRQVAPADGTFTDTFVPYGVHVYVWE
ncbi:MAG: hypothetical protein A3K19_11420 [Lentisphaerae bacterium RIFOXYB12_FULL_65_16]|nr:MAG: hypothetical protein A3K18_09750 [Lentisphaerae bacterium RIFOXYA12_64_32]OGV90187.1 MAG: hypothetical protein A3K19_11420 [Lentisphaerae bacterium RIFOXYB12_FULL_65_16]